MVIAIFLVGGCALYSAKKENILFEDIAIIGATSVMSGLLGGFLLYLSVTYSLDDIVEMVKKGDYGFLRGGLVFYGALIAGVLGGIIAVRITKAPLVSVERCVVPFIPFGHAIGRVGCVLGGCCHGAPYDGFGAIHYPNSLFGLDPNQGYFPVQLLEAVALICIGFLLLWRRRKAHKQCDLLFMYLGLYAVARFFIEFLRGDKIRGLAGGISTSQWVSLLLIVGYIAYYLFYKLLSKRNTRK